MTLPTRGKHFRNIALIFGIMLFLWMRLEDFQMLPVVAFGTAFAALTLLGWLLGRLGDKTISTRALVFGAILSGALLGLSAVITISALMFFKTATHAHVFPDYPPAQILAMLERAPAWTLAGALGGAGVLLLRFALPNKIVAQSTES
jgi:hypothetical protein